MASSYDLELDLKTPPAWLSNIIMFIIHVLNYTCGYSFANSC